MTAPRQPSIARTSRALATCIALGCFDPAPAGFAAANGSASTPATSLAGSPADALANFSANSPANASTPIVEPDARLLGLNARIREAELLLEPEKLAEPEAACADLDGAERAIMRERLALARDGIAQRQAAITGTALAEAEESLANARLLLARKAPPALRRELELESAEDLLLRSLAADNGDAAIALGVATEAEAARARRILAVARELLPERETQRALSATATETATDPTIFRTALLGGILALVASDLEFDAAADLAIGSTGAVEGARAATEARAKAALLLDVALRSELPQRGTLAELLALARARAGGVDEAMRTQLLTTAARSSDAAIALVARFAGDAMDDAMGGAARGAARGEKDAPPQGATAAGEALAVLAACAEARRRALAAERGPADAIDFAAIDAAFARLLSRAEATAAGASDARSEALGAIAAACAARFDRPMRDAALLPAATPLYVALASFRASREGTRVDVPASLERLADQAAADPRIAPWFTIPYASALARRGPENASRAADHLLALAATCGPGLRTRAALDIALAERRAAAHASLRDEERWAEALALAARVFASDPERPSWLLASADLALFPAFGDADPARAERILGEVDASLPPRELRAIELAIVRGAATRPTPRDLAPLRARAASNARSLGRDSTELLVRSDALRASLALEARDLAEAADLSANAIERDPRSAAAERAALVWIAATLARGERHADVRNEDETDEGAPASLAAIAARSAKVRDALVAATNAVARGLDAPTDEMPGALAAEVRRQGMLLATLALPLGETGDAPVLRAMGLLVARDPAAVESSRRAVELAPNDRRAMWSLGEALLASATPPDRAEGFALLRELAPIGAAERDRLWWRAQASMLETLAQESAGGDDPAGSARRAGDVVARANRLATIDPALGGAVIARRIEGARARAAESGRAPREGVPK